MLKPPNCGRSRYPSLMAPVGADADIRICFVQMAALSFGFYNPRRKSHMKYISFLLPMVLAGCGPMDGDGIVEVLDNKIVQGCYQSNGLPSIEITKSDIRSEGIIVYPKYQFATHGLNAYEVIIARPRVLLTSAEKILDGKAYEFGKVTDVNSSTVFFVTRESDGVALSIISNPDYKRHKYSRFPCGSN